MAGIHKKNFKRDRNSAKNFEKIAKVCTCGNFLSNAGCREFAPNAGMVGLPIGGGNMQFGVISAHSDGGVRPVSKSFKNGKEYLRFQLIQLQVC